MSLIYNGTTIGDVVYKDSKNTSGVALCKLIFNETPVWENHAFSDWSIVTNATCTAAGSKKRTCNRTGCGHSETATIAATGHTSKSYPTVAATCTETGLTGGTYCSVCNTVLTNRTTVAALGHSWNTPTYSWTGYTACTASRTCKNNTSHKETVSASITSAVTTAATCTTAGVRTYTATFSGASWTSTQTTTEAIAATGHNWNTTTYSWSSDKSTCTATRTCKTNSSHKETATGTVTSAVTTAATCTTKGVRTYTATFDKSWATTQTATVDIAALDHSWTVSYSWNGISSCTATRSCGRNSAHNITSTATITSNVTTAPTCTTDGVRTYTATFSDSWASTQTKTATEPKTGHSWNTTTYAWDGYGKCTATRTCKNGTHPETATATITNAVTTAATCTVNGVRTYTATFSGVSWAATQTKTETINATGHNWNTATYSWNGYNSCTATRVCSKDGSHKQTSTATITNAVTTAATCTTTGIRTYTAAFSDSWAATQTKTETIAAPGHSWNTATYSWSSDKSTCTATRTCKTNSAHKETSTATITSSVTTAPTCTADGVRTYTATFSDSWASTQTTTATEPKTGHNWATTHYTWSTDKSTCTAARSCQNAGHPDVAYATVTSAITTTATCTTAGVRTYTATFSGVSWATTQTTTDTIPATGHSWTDSTGMIPGTCSNCGAQANSVEVELGIPYKLDIPGSNIDITGTWSTADGRSGTFSEYSVEYSGTPGVFYSYIIVQPYLVDNGFSFDVILITPYSHITLEENLTIRPSIDDYTVNILLTDVSYAEPMPEICIDQENRGLIEFDLNTEYLYIPAVVEYDDLEHVVTSVGPAAFADGLFEGDENCNHLQSVAVGETVARIYNGAFTFCYDLESVSLPDCITEIGNSAFYGCDNLQSIGTSFSNFGLPQSLTYLGDNAFAGCSRLQTLDSLGAITSINDYTFYGCTSLYHIVIPSSVTYIARDAFSGCSSLSEIIFEGTVDQWYAIRKDQYWNEGSGDYSVYCAASDAWLDKESANVIPDGGEIILDSSNVHLAGEVDADGNLELSDTIYLDGLRYQVTGIGDETFVGNSDIQTISIPEGVTEIGYSAFNGCDNLVSVYLPETLSYIGEAAFYNCVNLYSIGIPEGVTCIQASTFENCYALDDITIPTSLECIGSCAFANTGLQRMMLQTGVTEIHSQAFYGCANLTGILLPSTLTMFEDGIFMDCANLELIYFEGTTEQWYAIEKGADWAYGTGQFEIYCYDGVISKDNADGDGSGDSGGGNNDYSDSPVATITLDNDWYGDITINYTSNTGPGTIMIAPEGTATVFEPVCGTSIFFTDPEECMYISGVSYVSVSGNVYEYIAPNTPGTYHWPVDRS